jgi:hypothetical protein
MTDKHDKHGYSNFKNAACYVVSAAEVSAANSALEALGWPGPNNFSVPLTTARGRVTHYACGVSLTDEMQEAWSSALDGMLTLKKVDNTTVREYSKSRGRPMKLFSRR